jgi:predicted membrane protein
MRIINGAQENRITKYYGTEKALNCAVLDFGLSDSDADKVVQKALDMITQKIMYPISGLFGTFFAYLFSTEKWRNLWNTPDALYCSAFVKEAYLAAGIDLAEGVATTNTSPEHLWQTKIPHKTYVLRQA